VNEREKGNEIDSENATEIEGDVTMRRLVDVVEMVEVVVHHQDEAIRPIDVVEQEQELIQDAHVHQLIDDRLDPTVHDAIAVPARAVQIVHQALVHLVSQIIFFFGFK
jgi:hypothetical protein